VYSAILHKYAFAEGLLASSWY